MACYVTWAQMIVMFCGRKALESAVLGVGGDNEQGLAVGQTRDERGDRTQLQKQGR